MSEENSEEKKLQQQGDINLDRGNFNENIAGDQIDVARDYINIKNIKNIYNRESSASLNRPNNLRQTGSANFVGREGKLKELHQLLEDSEQVSISAIAGMGGIGKTELALQYARQYEDDYPGGLGWFTVRKENLVAQIIDFAGILNIFPPKELNSDLGKVQYCWNYWLNQLDFKPALIVLDDLPDYGEFYQEKIAPYLPSVSNGIKVLITSRQHPGANITAIDLDVLTESAAMELLGKLAGNQRIDHQQETAQDLCQWLGYLPLGLELVGRYLGIHRSLTLEETLKRLNGQKLKAESLLDQEQGDMTAKLGVAAAFELSWQELNPETQALGCYLSLFTSELFDWSWVESVAIGDGSQISIWKRCQNFLHGIWRSKSLAVEEEVKLQEMAEMGEKLRDRELINRNLLKVIVNSESSLKYSYQLHPLIAEYFRAKLEQQPQVTELKQNFCKVMIEIARSIPHTPTIKEIEAVTIAIPHLSFVAQDLLAYIDDEDLISLYFGLGKFYYGQGIYNQAEQWLEQSLTVCRERLGEQHPDVATSLNNLAALYKSQGRYTAAEPLYLQALELRKQLLGEQHPQVATSLNNLAALYESQGRYTAAEPLYLQALELSKQLLGEQHPDVATSLNNLALLYKSQGRYTAAEPLYLQALELSKQLLGEQHPQVAASLNNLALLYKSQGRYTAAEPLYLQALELSKQLLGEQHPDVATSLNNLALLYQSQGRYTAAEPLYLQALELRKQLLGEQHPDVATSLNNLAGLYQSQGKYTAAEPLYLQALAIAKTSFGENHPHTKTIQDNLNQCLISKYLSMPEAEMRQILPAEICEKLLQYKKKVEEEREKDKA